MTDVVDSGWIYFLYDPRDLNVRYVGKTNDAVGVDARLARHLQTSRTQQPLRTRLAKWITSLVADGNAPCVQPVAHLPLNRLDDAERAWIAYGHEKTTGIW